MPCEVRVSMPVTVSVQAIDAVSKAGWKTDVTHFGVNVRRTFPDSDDGFSCGVHVMKELRKVFTENEHALPDHVVIHAELIRKTRP